jgi:serine/threonine protein kinase HipA of HipAB toxin-antitoxin module
MNSKERYHLRNHGFLYEGQAGWRWSPAYDLNPVPTDIKQRILSTAINEDDNTAHSRWRWKWLDISN